MHIFGGPLVCLPQSHIELKVKAIPNHKINMKKSDQMLVFLVYLGDLGEK